MCYQSVMGRRVGERERERHVDPHSWYNINIDNSKLGPIIKRPRVAHPVRPLKSLLHAQISANRLGRLLYLSSAKQTCVQPQVKLHACAAAIRGWSACISDAAAAAAHLFKGP